MNANDLNLLRKIFQARVNLCETRAAEHREVMSVAPPGSNLEALRRRIEWYDNLGPYLDSFLGDVLRELRVVSPPNPEDPP